MAYNESGYPVGRAELSIRSHRSHRHAAMRMDIRPSQRRKGYATQLYTYARARALQLDCDMLTVRTLGTTPALPASDYGAGAGFAAAMGFDCGHLPEVMQRLILPLPNNAVLLARLVSSLSLAARDYGVRQWTGPTPQQHAEDVAYLESRLTHDAPHGSMPVDPSPVDGSWLQRIEACRTARGELGVQAVALHRVTSTVVGHTLVTIDPLQPQHAWQQITVVAPEHRGNRLGLLLKAVSIRAVIDAFPAVTAIDTFNAVENVHMVRINDVLGMRPIHAFQHWHQPIGTNT